MTEELGRGHILFLRSSCLAEASEQAAHRLTHTIEYSHDPPVLDTTERYYGSQRPTVVAERAGVHQDLSFAAVVVVQETPHEPTNARRWHDLCQPDRRWPSARSQVCVRRQLARIGQVVPLALPACDVLPADSVSMAVSMVYHREVWPRSSQLGLCDERRDDVLAPPPEPREDFSVYETCPHIGRLEARKPLPLKHSRLHDLD